LLITNETDQDVLLALKAGLSLQSDSLASWEKGTDFCRWIGVICSHRHKHRVLALNLSATGLVGSIGPSIGNLTHLRSLDLSCNLLNGEIPPQIGHLAHMSFLDLSNNLLQGDVAVGLRNCSHLVTIKLDLNHLTGGIPNWLADLPMLESMSLGKNNFTGVIPPSLGNLSSLQEVYRNDNHLCGPIPEVLGTLGSLNVLGLQVNHLSGSVPQTVFNSTLVHIGMQMNELEGTLPTNLGSSLPKIKYLILAENHFKGPIPVSIANATTMRSIDLSGNKFTGIVPPEIGTLCPDYLLLNKNQLKASSVQDWEFITPLANCTVLRGVTLQNNRFGGVFPSSISNLSAQLGILDIRFNEISGRVPNGIGNLPKLFKLGLSGNQFTGHIAESIGRLKLLQFLRLENNKLSGALPSSLGNLTQLQYLSVDNNSLEGPLPVNLGNLQQLIWATFSNNVLSGPLPGEIFSLSSFNYLPSEVGRLTTLTYLYIHGNNLSGVLPDSLSNCQNLMELRLDDNSFDGNIPTLTGTIPQELGFMNGMKELYLAQNYLIGQIPETMERMASLYRLDISFNRLVGQVPKNGMFTNLTGLYFNGNAKLCGGIEELNLPKIPRVIRNAIAVISIIILACFIVALIFLSSKKALRSPSAKTMTVDPSLLDGMYPRLSFSDLFQATNGFSADNFIGMGQYGSVYKGEILLKDLVTTVAVKALSKIRHRNLNRVITCCSCSDLNQNDFKALDLEFMFYGSLDKWLHPKVDSSYHVNVLTLLQRLNIAADIAAALDYLHNDCHPSIVHCDVKPRNILLGEDMVARVGDFGLTKILTDPLGEQLINSNSSMGILGTIGYVAPEYGEGGQISPPGDVYSFGIVLLELFTGKAPTHDMFTDGLNLLKYAKMAYPARLMEIVDPLLLSLEAEPGQINVIMNSITKLALSCSKNRPSERLCIRDVVDEIQTIKTCYSIAE
ncbi:hypothetical protein PVAP13_9KG253213, partial [Panicum virgatum]